MNYSKIMMYHLVKQMDYGGRSITSIAERFGINWRTVKRMVSMSEQEFTQGLEKGRMRKRSLDAYESFIKEKLTLYPDTSSAQVHDWLKNVMPTFPG